MIFIKDMQNGDRVSGTYFCKQKNSAVTRNGKPYDNAILQDKTGQIDAKIWEPDSQGIGEFQAMDYVEVVGEVSLFNGAPQLSIKRARYVDPASVDASLYYPVSARSTDEMYTELLSVVEGVKEEHLKALLNSLFVEDKDLAAAFRKSSAAKSVHHAFIGGLLEHTLGVAALCAVYCDRYPEMDRDLLLTAALCHDIGKTRELSLFPANDYTDEGQLMGHIVIGAQMLEERIRAIDGFPVLLHQKLIHCILAHHGEYEFGSPKKPAIMEAVALHMADNTDAKLESFRELTAGAKTPGWQGFNRVFDSNIYLERTGSTGGM